VFQGDGKSAIFDQLSPEESEEAYEFLYSALNLHCKYPGSFFMQSGMNGATLPGCRIPYNASTWNHPDFVHMLELMPPPKEEALAYLDGSNPHPPPRYAKALHFRGTAEPRDVVYVEVGPLPVSESTTVRQMTEVTPDGAIPWAARPFVALESIPFTMAEDEAALIKPLSDALMEAAGIPDGEVSGWSQMDPAASSLSRRQYNTMNFARAVGIGEGYAPLKPLPISWSYLDTQEGAWPAYPRFNFVFCNQGPYASALELRAAWDAGELAMCPMDTEWYTTNPGSMEPTEPVRSALPEPRTYYPEGARYALEPRGKAVEWMGWSFHVDNNPIRGLVFSDIRFKGERIVYEMMATEFAAYYGSAGASHNLYYSDGAYLQGSLVVGLTPNVDCPAHASFLSRGVTGGATGTRPSGTFSDSVCVFETPEGAPLYRHFTDPTPQANRNGVPSSLLTVRSIMTVGNYDYVQTAQFYLDGKLKYKKSASGYSMTEYVGPDWETAGSSLDAVANSAVPTFGQRFYSSVAGTTHLHSATWKVDLDIGDATTNALQTATTAWGTYEEATGAPRPGWISAEADGVLYTRKNLVATEAAFDKGDAAQFTVVSTSQTNAATGELRGYQVVLDGSDKVPFPETSVYAHMMNYSKYNLAVTKRKDVEHVDNSNAVMYVRPVAAPYDIGKWLDGEAISSDDVVVWLHASKLHYPQSEDVPMPALFTSGFTLKPMNFLERAGYTDIARADPDAPKCVMD